MSALPENELDLDKLFLPAWAQEPASAKHYADYEGEERPERKGERHGRRPPPGRERAPGERPREQRPRDQQGAPPRRREDRPPRPAQKPPQPPRTNREHREPAPLPEFAVSFVPDEKGVESLARQIKASGRAYPLFDIARLILQKPERYQVVLSVKKKPDGQPVQPLVVCALDDSPWLSEDEAVAHVLRNHFGTFYQAERTPAEPPKGKYTFVAQCGLSGVILGPPNYHDYQNQLRKLHAQRFSRMPFDVFKSRVKIVRDETVVKKWVEDQSWKTEYVCLNLPEPLRLDSRDAVEKHFREVHKETIIRPADSHTLGGAASRALRSPDLARLARAAWEDQRRFPLQLATALSQQFAAHGLQFFKVNKAITHVSVARPRYLDLETTPVSDGVTRIVEFVNAHPKSTRRQLVEALAPAPPAAPLPVQPAETAPAPDVAPAPAQPAEPSAEQTAVIADLHWLIHEGHVIEFANGILETAKKPAPRPPKPAPQPLEKSAEQTVETAAAATQDQAAEVIPAAPDSVPQKPATPAPEDHADAPAPTPAPSSAASSAEANPNPPLEAAASAPEPLADAGGHQA